ncbi:hypothetical protein ACFOJ6_04865 [Gordonia humi]|uniref:hypothetical protein n=1 Tax=Gordonia humi TaxID=686429 RepID=UPI0036121268
MMTCDADGLTVGDVLAPTGITALFDTPVSEVLDGLGLPRFDAPAQVGLPDLSSLNLRSFPSITGIDPVSLMKPIVDLLGTFGTGSMSGGADPVASLGGLAGLLRSGASALLDAASSVDIDWAGQAAAAAIGAATRTAGQSEQVAAQGTAMASDVASAGAIVGAGFTRLQSVVAKTAGLLAAAAPALATPPGQIAALGIAAEGLTEGLAVVAETRAQLVAPTAHIAGVGAPVSVSDPPTALTGDTWSTLLQQAGPLFRAGVQIAGSLLGVDGDAAPESDVAVGGRRDGVDRRDIARLLRTVRDRDGADYAAVDDRGPDVRCAVGDGSARCLHTSGAGRRHARDVSRRDSDRTRRPTGHQQCDRRRRYRTGIDQHRRTRLVQRCSAGADDIDGGRGRRASR